MKLYSEEEELAALSPLMLTDAGVPQLVKRVSKEVQLAEWLRHPIVLLILSSAIIPSIVYWLQKHRDLTASREKVALEIVNKNSIFEGQLYALYSELGLFHQGNLEKKPLAGELKTLQQDLDKSWSAHYLEFRKSYPDAHVWVDDLFGQGVVLKLFLPSDIKTLLSSKDKENLPASLPSSLKTLSNDIERYKATLSESLWELRILRDRCISKDYDFDKFGKTTEIQNGATKRLNELRDERTKIITDMSGIFSQ